MKNFNLSLFHKFSLIAACVTAFSAMTAQAQTLVTANLADPDPTIIQTQSGEPRTYENNGDLGFVFQVGSSNLLLSSLGLYAPSTGLAGATVVDLYAVSGDTVNTATDTLVASAKVKAGTTPDSQGFAYAATAPTLLLAGDQYAIYYVDSSVDAFYDAQFSPGSSAADHSKLFDTADITPLSTVLNASTANYDYYIGPNAKFTNIGLNVPEPSSLALLMAGGFAALAFFRLRRKA